MLEQLANHYIVCGAGRVGRGVVAELRRSGVPVVLIDNNKDRAQWGIDLDIPTLVADATLDETLQQAGIGKAKGLVTATSSDAQNVYVTLSARVLNPDLLISARASDEQAEEKLRRAGVTTVFTPYTFIGHRLAQSMLRPHVMSFLDVASAFGRSSELEIEIEQVRVSPSSRAASKTLEESRLRQTLGVIVLAVLKPNGEMQFNPAGGTSIEAGDVLIAMGERSKLKQMELALEE
jgi:voltage-gated potassium channel